MNSFSLREIITSNNIFPSSADFWKNSLHFPSDITLSAYPSTHTCELETAVKLCQKNRRTFLIMNKVPSQKTL